MITDDRFEEDIDTNRLILQQLLLLNNQMKTLVNEHLKHFDEWRNKNK